MKTHFLSRHQGGGLSYICISLHFSLQVTFILNADLDGTAINYLQYLLGALKSTPRANKI